MITLLSSFEVWKGVVLEEQIKGLQDTSLLDGFRDLDWEWFFLDLVRDYSEVVSIIALAWWLLQFGFREYLGVIEGYCALARIQTVKELYLELLPSDLATFSEDTIKGPGVALLGPSRSVI